MRKIKIFLILITNVFVYQSVNSQTVEPEFGKIITKNSQINESAIYEARDAVVFKPNFKFKATPELTVYNSEFQNHIEQLYVDFEEYTLMGGPELDQSTSNLSADQIEHLSDIDNDNKFLHYANEYLDQNIPVNTIVPEKKLSARVNESMILDASYQDLSSNPNYTNPESRNLTSNSIGSLPGSINVSPTGAATYNIPLSIASGTAGMQPQVGIAYNSQSGNGLLGMKWNLTGLSAITRTSSTIYHDGEVNGVNLDANDKFSLDGVRLIKNSDGTYSKETEDFSKISVHEGTSGNPNYFTVLTRDGKKITYGTNGAGNASIKAKGSSKIIVWCISKIEDVNGNYVEYVYENQGNSNGKYWIKEIKYTGNSKLSIAPYNSIKFFYEKRQDITSGYIAGSKSVQDNILYKVKSFSDGELFREYNFKYINDDFSKLVEIIVKNSSGDQYNSTIVQWGDNNKVVIDQITTIETPVQNIDPKNHNMIAYDYDGDGVDELVGLYTHIDDLKACQVYNYKDKKFVKLNNCTNVPTNIITSNHISGVIKPDVVDFTGDGIKDYVVTTWVNESILRFYLPFKEEYFPYDVFTNNVAREPSIFNFSDLDYDGRGEIVVLNRFKTGLLYECHIVSPWLNDNSKNHTVKLEFNGTPYKILMIDCNSDGIKDLFVFTNEEMKVFKGKSGSFSNNALYVNNQISGKKEDHRIIPSDFNSDGVIDLLLVGKNSEDIRIAYGNGSGGFNVEVLTGIKGVMDSDTDKDDDKSNVVVTDFNNDGKLDFILFNTEYIWKDDFWSKPWKEFDKMIVSWYKSTGTGFVKVKEAITNQEDDAYSRHVVQGDFDGDGRLDMLNYGFDCYNGTNTDKWRVYNSFNENFQANNVMKITNGSNSQTTINYIPLTDNSIYTKDKQTSYPVNIITTPLYTVSSLNIEDGTNNGNTISYKYKNAIIHRQGKGFLGFEEVKTKNNTTGIENINTYSLTSTFMSFLSSSITNLVSGEETKKISEVTNDIEANVIGGKRFYLKQNSSIKKDYLKGTNITSTNNTFNDYGNVLTSTVSNGIDVVSTTNTYINKSKGDFTFISLPKSTEVKSIRTVGNAIEDEITRKTEFSYYDNGSLKEKKIEPLDDKGTVELFRYNNFGNIDTLELKANNLTTRYSVTEYDSKGRFVKLTRDSKDFETTYNYNKKGELLSVKDPNNRVTNYTYDSWGNNTLVRDHDGLWGETKLIWINSSSYYKLETASNSPWKRTDYDKYGRVIATQSLIHDNVVYTKNEYYPDQREFRKSKPYLQGEDIEFIVTKYDSYGRKTKITDNSLETSFTYTLDSNSDLYSETITLPSDQQKTSVYDKSGKKISSTDEGGVVNYTFNSAGLVRKITSGGATYSMEYDIFGQRTKLIDPDAGTTETHYNAFGEVIYNKDARNNTISNITYDKLGRKKLETWSDGNTREWEYDTEFKGSLEKVTDKLNGNEISSITYEYDNKFRLESETEKIGDDNYSMYYTYNNFNKLLTTKYPSDIIITNVYDGNGTLTNVNMGSQPVWVLGDVNKYGQITSYTNGDGKTVTTTYNNEYNTLESIVASGVQNLTYSIKSETGNLEFRRDITGGKKPYLCEYFKYDDVNRLTDSRVYLDSPISNPQGAYAAAIPDPTHDPLEDSDYQYNAYVDKDYIYNANGTFNTHSDAGTYHYQANNHRVRKITNATLHYKPVAIEDITYNRFNKVSSITTSETNKKLELTYGTHNERILSKYFESNILKRTKTYALGTYEETKDESTGTIKKITYISTGSGLTAFYKSENGQSGDIYFLYTDHLGSPYAVTDVTGDVKERYSFTPWGKHRNSANWTLPLSSSPQYFTRGFTGHEHLDEFGLINMNGRMYDPQIGLFISPDPYVQAPDFSQNFNRYGYCLNNPLVYTDPSGQLFFMPILIGATIGGTINLLTNWNRIDDFEDGASIFGTGAIVGAVGAAGFQLAERASNYGLGSHSFLGSLSISATYEDGINSYSLGVGAGINNFAFGVSINGYGYYRTYYGGAMGPDDKPNNQAVGGISYTSGKFSFRLENDIMGDGNDRWRSNALEIGYRNFVIGTNLYNNSPKDELQVTEKYGVDYQGKLNKSGQGAWEDGKTYTSPVYIGVKYARSRIRLGYSHPLVQDFTQNLIHSRGFKFMNAPLFNKYDKFKTDLYIYSTKQNPYSLW